MDRLLAGLIIRACRLVYEGFFQAFWPFSFVVLLGI